MIVTHDLRQALGRVSDSLYTLDYYQRAATTVQRPESQRVQNEYYLSIRKRHAGRLRLLIHDVTVGVRLSREARRRWRKVVKPALARLRTERAS